MLSPTCTPPSATAATPLATPLPPRCCPFRFLSCPTAALRHGIQHCDATEQHALTDKHKQGYSAVLPLPCCGVAMRRRGRLADLRVIALVLLGYPGAVQ